MSEQQPSHQRLGEYLERVQSAIKAVLPPAAWVVAELSSIKGSPKGHVYLELVDSDGGREVAKARATMFSGVAGAVMRRWQDATGGQPQAGMKLLLQVRADFNVQYGFSLQVLGIDPAYTLGDMQLQRQRTIASLKERGMFDLQRRLPAPAGFWRIAVISPHEAAGLADFRRDADALADAGVCAFEYFSATFQGRETSESIRGALKAAHERHQQAPFDVLCIIRGGGSKSDLAWLDDATLAAWVCRFPVPVFTGIGHEIDESLLDLVAHRSFDTPSKVIGFFRTTFQAEAAAIELLIERISGGLLKIVSGQRAKIDQALPRFSNRSRSILAQHERRVASAGHSFAQAQVGLLHRHRSRQQTLAASFERLAQQQRSQQAMHVQMTGARFSAAAKALVEREKGRFSLVTTLYDKTNPMTLLSKGFALVRDQDGELVTSAARARASSSLGLAFADGSVVVKADGE